VVVSLSNGSTLKLRNVRHVLKLKRNLISVEQFADGGMNTTFDGDVCKITKGAMVMAYEKKERTLYRTSGSKASISIALSEVNAQRLGHMSEKGMKVMLFKDKLSRLKSVDLDFCEDCVYGKQERVSFSMVRKTLKAEKLELVHTNILGKALIPSLRGSLYFVSFIDNSNRKVWAYFLKYKSNLFEVFKKWLAQVENESGRKLKYLKSDNRGEY